MNLIALDQTTSTVVLGGGVEQSILCSSIVHLQNGQGMMDYVVHKLHVTFLGLDSKIQTIYAS